MYVVPYLVVNAWLVTITLLQHTCARRLGTYSRRSCFLSVDQADVWDEQQGLRLGCSCAPSSRHTTKCQPGRAWRVSGGAPRDRAPGLARRHPALPHYEASEWDWLRGALATVDRSYGLLDHVFHHIADTHVRRHTLP